MSRSYGQYCGLARALDVVGDRWNLLIVRQLLMAPARYRELLDGLPGVATNLLDDKTFPYLAVTMREDFPRVMVTRATARIMLWNREMFFLDHSVWFASALR